MEPKLALWIEPDTLGFFLISPMPACKQEPHLCEQMRLAGFLPQPEQDHDDLDTYQRRLPSPFQPHPDGGGNVARSRHHRRPHLL